MTFFLVAQFSFATDEVYSEMRHAKRFDRQIMNEDNEISDCLINTNNDTF